MGAVKKKMKVAKVRYLGMEFNSKGKEKSQHAAIPWPEWWLQYTQYVN